MSESKLIGSCGIMFESDVHGRGPLVTLPRRDTRPGEKCVTLSRFDGDDFVEVDVYRDEARETAAMLIAFADGEA